MTTMANASKGVTVNINNAIPLLALAIVVIWSTPPNVLQLPSSEAPWQANITEGTVCILQALFNIPIKWVCSIICHQQLEAQKHP